MKIVNVIPLKKGLFGEDLSYFTTKDIELGSVVSIMIRNKKTLGLVVSTADASGSKINIKDLKFNLKKIIEVKGKSFFSKSYLDAVVLASRYFASSKSAAMAALIPAVFREEYDKISRIKNSTPKFKKTSLLTTRNERLLFQEPFDDRVSIYKTMIRENFAQKKSVYIVLPNENDIKIFESHLSKGIEQFTYTFYPNTAPVKTIEKVKAALAEAHPILIIGTGPFLSIPRKDIGAIILENESATGYKMITRPHIDIRTFVEIYASRINAKFVIGSDLLRFETISRHEKDNLTALHPLFFRINFPNEIQIENPRGENSAMTGDEKAPFKIFSESTINEIKHSIVNEENVFVFTLRKGLATQTICRDCQEVMSCQKCQSPLVLYTSRAENRRFFVCNKCGEERSSEAACQNCGSWNLFPLGIGTDTAYEELSRIFPKTKIFCLNKDVSKNKRDAKKIIKEFEDSAGAILIGTEMALYYLNEKVSLSVIAAFDSFWSIPNYKISEKIIHLVVNIISKTENYLIIQTKNLRDPAIVAIKAKNLLPFVRGELEDREKMGYPPYMRFIKIKHIGSKPEALKAREMLKEIFAEYKPLIFSGFVAQIKGKYITNALLKVDAKKWSLRELTVGGKIDKILLAKLLSLPLPFEIFVDPEDLL